MITVSSVEAQNSFGQLLDAVQNEPVAITKEGRPAAFIVSPREMEDVLDARRRRSAAIADLEAWSAQAASRATPEASALSDDDINLLVHATR